MYKRLLKKEILLFSSFSSVSKEVSVSLRREMIVWIRFIVSSENKRLNSVIFF